MKIYRVCSGKMMISNSQKTAKMCITCTIVPGLMELFISPNQSVVDHKHERKSSHRDVLYIFQNI